MSASEIQFFLKQKALEDQKNHKAPVIAAKNNVVVNVIQANAQPQIQKMQVQAKSNTAVVMK